VQKALSCITVDADRLMPILQCTNTLDCAHLLHTRQSLWNNTVCTVYY